MRQILHRYTVNVGISDLVHEHVVLDLRRLVTRGHHKIIKWQTSSAKIPYSYSTYLLWVETILTEMIENNLKGGENSALPGRVRILNDNSNHVAHVYW